MEQDSGWVEMLDPGTRWGAYLMIERPSTTSLEWEGTLRSVHSVTGDSPAPGRYVWRLESGGEVCCADLDGEAEPRRTRGHEVPALLKELHASD